MQYSDNKISQTLFEELIKQILVIQNNESLMPTITEEILTDVLFNLLPVKFTYNTTYRAVLKIATNM